jgi:hypothetical protein
MNSSLTTIPTEYEVFGPTAECANCFDFTLIFEDGFFSILPSTLLLLVIPARLLFLNREKRRVGGRNLQYAKLVSMHLKSHSAPVDAFLVFYRHFSSPQVCLVGSVCCPA